MLSMAPARPHLPLVLLYLLAHGLGTYALAVAVLVTLGWRLPTEADVLLRDVQASPWQMLWALAGVLTVLCLDDRHDEMEQALPTPGWLRRLRMLVPCALLGTGALLLGAALSGREIGVALTDWAFAAGVVLVARLGVSTAPALVLGCLVVLFMWVFGVSESTLAPYPWALLMLPFDPARLAVALGWLVVAVTASAAGATPRGR
jgi:hypothetical protein